MDPKVSGQVPSDDESAGFVVDTDQLALALESVDWEQPTEERRLKILDEMPVTSKLVDDE